MKPCLLTKIPEAPKAKALKTSVPRRTPPSRKTGTRPCAALTTWICHHFGISKPNLTPKSASLHPQLSEHENKLLEPRAMEAEYLLQGSDGGWNVVQLTSSMVGDDNTSCTRLNGQPCCMFKYVQDNSEWMLTCSAQRNTSATKKRSAYCPPQ